MANVKNFIEFGGDANEAVNEVVKFGEAIDKQAKGIVKLSKVVETVFPKIKRIVEDSLGNSRTVNANPIKVVEEGITSSGAKIVQTTMKHGQKILSITKQITTDIEKNDREAMAKRSLLWSEGALGVREWSKAQRAVAAEEERLRKEALAGLKEWSNAKKLAKAEDKKLAKEQATEEERLRKEALAGLREWSRAKRLVKAEEARLTKEQAALDKLNTKNAIAAGEEVFQKRRQYASMWAKLLNDQDKKQNKEANRNSSMGAGDQMIGLLGGITPTATLAGRASMSSISSTLENMIAKGKISRQVMLDLFSAIRYNTLETFKLAQANGQLTPEMRAAESAIRRLISAHKDLNTSGTRSSEMLITFKGAMRIFLVQQFHNVVRELSNSISVTSARSAEFYKSIGLIQTITQDAAKSTKNWAMSLNDLSTEFNIDLLDASAAAYEAISNQVVDSSTALGFLSKAFEFAKITGSSAKDSVNLLSSAINGFALNATHTDEISAKLFKTIDVGRVTASQMANVLGNVAPTAYIAGASIDELMAGIATLTREGVRADTSITLMNNIFTSLIKPSEALTETIRSWGYESGQAAIQGMTFVGVLKKLLQEEQNGGAARLGELFPNIRSLRSSVGLLQDFETSYVKSFNEISNATDEAAKASEIMGENTGVAFQKVQKSLSNLMVTHFGTELMEIVVRLDNDFGGLSEAIIPVVDGMSNIAQLGADIISVFASIDRQTTGVTSNLSTLIPTVFSLTAGYYSLSPIVQLVSVRSQFLTSQLNNVVAANVANVTWLTRAKVALLGYELNVKGAATANWTFAASASAVTFGLAAAVGALAYLVSSSYDIRRQVEGMEDEVIGRLNKIYEKSIDNLTKDLRSRNKVLTDGLNEEMRTLKQYQAFVNRILSNGVEAPLGKQFGADLNDAKAIEDTVSKLKALDSIMGGLKAKAGNLTLLGDVEGAGKAYDELVKSAKEFNNELSRTSEKLKESIEKLGDKKEDSLLEKKLFGKEGAAKNKVLVAEFTRLMQEADKAGSKEDALKFAGKAQDVAGKIDSTGKGKSSARFDLEVQAIELQIKLQKELQSMLPERIQQNTLLTEQEASQKRILDLKIQERDASQKILEIQQGLNKELEKRTLAQTDATAKRDEMEKKLIGGFAGAGARIGEKNFFGGETDRATGFRHMDPLFQQFTQQMEQINKELEHALATNNTVMVEHLRKEIARQSITIETLLENNKNAKMPGDGLSNLLTKEEFEIEKARRVELLNLLKEYSATNGNVGATAAGLVEIESAISRAQTETAVALQGMQGLKDLYKDIWNDVGKGVNAPMNDLTTTVKNLGAAVNELKGALSGQMGSAGLPTRASGGRIGRDGTTANFDPKEFVMNPMASNRFGPQLAAMNSNFNGGGASSSSIINVGDVHVNQYGPTNTSQTADEIGRSLRRKIAMGTVRLK